MISREELNGLLDGLEADRVENLLAGRRLAVADTFDVLPCPGASLKDIFLPLFAAYRQEVIAREIIEANQRPMEVQLASLRFFDLAGDRPTHAGILLFGRTPRFHLPGAYTQYLRFPADDFTEVPSDQAEIGGDLLAVLRELELRIRTNIPTTLRPETPLREKMISAYPEQAVRELVMNAVMHRDYQSNTPMRLYWFSNRIEIQNPGGLFGGVTPANYMTQNSYRNPVIAEAMKGLGYVNRFGYGIQRAQKLLAENGNPPAEFTFDADSVRVILRSKPQA